MTKKYPAVFLVIVFPMFVFAQTDPIALQGMRNPLANPPANNSVSVPQIHQKQQGPKALPKKLPHEPFIIPTQEAQSSEELPQGVSVINSFVYMKPTDPKLVAWRNAFFDKIKELEDAGTLYVESGAPLPDGFFTMHTASNGWHINFLRMAANLHVSRQPRVVSPLLPSNPASDFLQQIQSGPAALPIAPVPSGGGLGSPVGGSGSITSGGGFVGTANDWIAQTPAGKGNISIYGEITLYKTYSSDIMLPFWIDNAAGFVFNFNALQNSQLTVNGEHRGVVRIGFPGTDLAMTFETKHQGPLNTPYTYVLFYRLIRISENQLIKQKITYEQFMEYGEKRGYWEQGWTPFGKRWKLNPNSAWQESK